MIVEIEIPRKLYRKLEQLAEKSNGILSVQDIIVDAVEFWVRLKKAVDNAAKRDRKIHKKRIYFTLDLDLYSVFKEFAVPPGELFKVLLMEYLIARDTQEVVELSRYKSPDEEIQVLFTEMAKIAVELELDEFLEKAQPIASRLNEIGFQITDDYLKDYWYNYNYAAEESLSEEHTTQKSEREGDGNYENQEQQD